jgi:phosphoribosylanthranilate isomerase
MRPERALEVKVCGMRDARNIEQIADLSPDYLGFIFVPESPRYVGEHFEQEMIGHVPSSISTVGVFRNHAREFVIECVRRFGLSIVQLHGAEDPEYVRLLKGELPSVKIWKALEIGCREDLSTLNHDFGGVDRFVLDNGAGGTGRSFDWRWLLEYEGPLPFVLAGGIGDTTIGAALEIAREVSDLVALDINSCVESEPGMKDAHKVKEILNKVRS